MTKIILALAAIAATGNALEPPRRRLRDSVDLTQIKEQAEASAFTGSLSFKLDAGAADAQGADALADQVAGLISCSSAKRVFRPAGKHEAKHVAKGLNLWYAVKCAADDEGALEASLAAASKLEAYLALSDEDHDDHHHGTTRSFPRRRCIKAARRFFSFSLPACERPFYRAHARDSSPAPRSLRVGRWRRLVSPARIS